MDLGSHPSAMALAVMHGDGQGQWHQSWPVMEVWTGWCGARREVVLGELGQGGEPGRMNPAGCPAKSGKVFEAASVLGKGQAIPCIGSRGYKISGNRWGW